MAKKKTKKTKEKFEYSNEIIGVLLILLSIIGMLGYGRAGNFIRSFTVFLVGIAYFPFRDNFLDSYCLKNPFKYLPFKIFPFIIIFYLY